MAASVELKPYQDVVGYLGSAVVESTGEVCGSASPILSPASPGAISGAQSSMRMQVGCRLDLAHVDGRIVVLLPDRPDDKLRKMLGSGAVISATPTLRRRPNDAVAFAPRSSRNSWTGRRCSRVVDATPARENQASHSPVCSTVGETRRLNINSRFCPQVSLSSSSSLKIQGRSRRLPHFWRHGLR